MKEPAAARLPRDTARETARRAGRRAPGSSAAAGSHPDAGPALSPLTEAALLQGVSGGERQRLSRLFEERRYGRGRAIFVKGDPGDCACFLKIGLVKLLTHSHGSRETLLSILKPGDVFGELLLSEESRAFTAVAATDVTVDAISRGNFLRLLSSHAGVALNFIRVLSRRLVEAQRAVAEFGHTWSYHRLAKVLLRLADEHGLPSPSGILIPLSLTHAELANMIGTTRETVTVQLVRFKRLGLLRREGRQFAVDRARLVDFLRSEELRFHGFPRGAAA